MKLGLKDKEFQLNKNILVMNNLNLIKNQESAKNNDQSSTKEDENIIYDEPIEYCSSPKIGLVSIHGSRNNYTKFIKFTEDKTDIPNTISMYIKPIKTEFDIDDKNNSETKDDSNLFFQKRQQTHKIEKVQAKRVSTINSYTSNLMKATKSEKYNVLNHKLLDKKIDNKKKKTTKKDEKIEKIPEKVEKIEKIEKTKKVQENEKTGKKWDKPPKDKAKIFKRKSISYSISALSEKMTKIKNKLNHNQEIIEKSKEENKDSDEDRDISKSKTKSKEKDETDKNDMTPNIIIYGSESSDNNNEESNMADESINISKHKNPDEFLKKKNKSNISTNANNLDKSETKIVKPRSKPSGSVIHKLNTKQQKVKKSRMQRKFTSSNISNKIKLNHKYSSANDYEKNKNKDKEKKKISILKLLTTKNLFKDDKDKDSTNKYKHRNSVSKHILSIQQYNQFSLKKNSINSPKDQKDNTKSVKPSSELSLKLTKVDGEFLKKSNKNLRHNELDKSIVKKCSFNSNINIPRIAIKTQENDTNEIHLVVKGKEETIINYTNQQMIEDEKDYMIQCLKVLAKLKKEGAPRCKQKVNFNFPPEEKQKKIALFDLDETLVHCNNNAPGMNGDEVSVKLPTNKIVKVGLNIRKNWKKAFDLIKNHYHIVIFTASHPSYADAVLDYLDKENKYFKYRLYRSHCIQCDVDGFKFYVKDLDTLDEHYNLKDIVLIDNSILSFAYHLYNGIPIVPFIDQANDTELMYTAHYLVSIANYDDLSLENKKHLNLDNLLTMAKMINEMDEEEEEEEEDDNGKDTGGIINLKPPEPADEGKPKPQDKPTGNDSTNVISPIPVIEINGTEVSKTNDNNEETNRGRQSISRSRKTIKIANDMRKNLDEILTKKKKELEIINKN